MATVAKPPTKEMPFLDHLEELRWRLIWTLIAVAIAFGIAFFLVYRGDVIGILEQPILPYLGGRKLVYTSPGDPFRIVMTTSFALGVVLALPVIIYQVWAFLSPALYRHEKMIVIPVLFGATLLFFGGASVAYFYALPFTLKFLTGFGGESLEAMITVKAYFDFAISMCLTFGAVFELPIVLTALTALGLVTPMFLRQYRRHAFVLCAVGAALITPGDLVTSTLMLIVPLYGLYEFSIVLSDVVYKRRQRRAALAEEELELPA
jgi:sec-independent protein translocase protein TatC